MQNTQKECHFVRLFINVRKLANCARNKQPFIAQYVYWANSNNGRQYLRRNIMLIVKKDFTFKMA